MKPLEFINEGSTQRLHNIRTDADQRWVSVSRPCQLVPISVNIGGSPERILLGEDRRDNVRHLITLARGKDLYFEGILTEDNVYMPKQELIAADVGPVRHICTAGSYLVLLLNDGRLYYVRWSAGEKDYTALGTPPSEPMLSVSAVEQHAYTEQIPDIQLKPAIADPRAGIPDTVAEQADALIRKQWLQLTERIAAQGYFMQPVRVRLALELNDGSYYSVSEWMSPEVSPLCYDDIHFAVQHGEGVSVTALTGGVLRVAPYRLSATVTGMPDGVWRDIFSRMVLMVSSRYDTLADTPPQMHFRAESDEILAVARMRTEAELQALLNRAAMRRAYVGAAADGTYTIAPPQGDDVDEPATLHAIAGRADALIGHGAYLHTSLGAVVTTYRPGNPFAAISATECGSTVRFMSALPSGGGAYTRQYLYLFTDNSITALTHDASGRHTNCRVISPLTVSDAARAVSTDRCVWALADNGSLLRLRNVNPETVMRRLPHYLSLGWDARYDELWIMKSEQSIVLQQPDSDSVQGYTRSGIPSVPAIRSGTILGQDAQGILLYTTADGKDNGDDMMDGVGRCTLYSGAIPARSVVCLHVQARVPADMHLEAVARLEPDPEYGACAPVQQLVSTHLSLSESTCATPQHTYLLPVRLPSRRLLPSGVQLRIDLRLTGRVGSCIAYLSDV